jgi:mannose-6-phosphate isomerase
VRLKTTLSARSTSPVERIEKPWGYELLWANTEHYAAKLLHVRAGESLSLQFHRLKEETLYLESGECVLLAGQSEEQLQPVSFSIGTAFHIPPGLLHRLSAVTDCRIFEVSTPHLTDVVRLEDRYGRK